jgi:hypothetical protein
MFESIGHKGIKILVFVNLLYFYKSEQFLKYELEISFGNLCDNIISCLT